MRDEFRKIIGFWLELGVDGFRVDAAPFLINLLGVDNADGMEAAHGFLEELREYVTVRKGNAILLGEVDEGLSTIADYFGGGNQLQALFNFPVNRFLFLGLAQQSADPVAFGLGQLPSIPGSGQWVNFLRHHDELNLSRVTREQREQIFSAFGSDPDLQIYGRGLRRRLAPMLEGDLSRIKLAYSLLFSLPGAPTLFYGEEIGMGEQPRLEGRMAVRAPMQWTGTRNGGFSAAEPKNLVRLMLDDGDYGYENVNVSAQRAHPDSLLNWLASLIRTRKECSEIGTGTWKTLETGSDAIFAIRYDTADVSVVVLNNLSGEAHTITLELPDLDSAVVTDLFEDRIYDPITKAKQRMRIDPYGYRWIRLGGVY